MVIKSGLGECFSFLFDLIISQLFIGAISSFIELIRIIAIKILSKYILKEEYIQNYGIYLQPVITCVSLTCIGVSIFYISKWTEGDNCNTFDIIKYFIYFILICILFGFVLFFSFYYFRITQKEKSMTDEKYGFKRF